MEIKFKKLSEKAIMPKKSTDGAIAFDVYVPRDVLLVKGRQIIPLEFAIELPLGYEAKIEPRSGFSAKGMEGSMVFPRPDGTTSIIEHTRIDCDVLTGKVDSDYRDGVGVIVNNREVCEYIIPEGTRIAQMTIYFSDPKWKFVESDELSETDRKGGFGSTGIK